MLLMMFVYSKDVDFEELARCTDDFNGAQCKAVCVEAVSCCLHLLMNMTYCATVLISGLQRISLLMKN